jgi:hypothetical protein
MSREIFMVGVAALYLIGLAVVLALRAGETMPQGGAGAIALLMLPLIWGAGPIVLAIVWILLKRGDLASARFGLLVFAALYLVIVAVHWYWGELI